MTMQQLKSQQKMSTISEAKFLQQFPHFKSQWHSQGNCFKHMYSSDLCELRVLRKVSVKDLDLYSSREAYSFAFCPRVYKYSIEKNELIDSQIAFDIKVLLEHVPSRLDPSLSNEQIASKIIDILRGLEYLRLRVGPFRIKKGMIGLTSLGIIKVWMNEDFAANFAEQEASSEEEMLQDLFRLFPENETINNLRQQHFVNLNSMIQFMEENKKEKFQQRINKKALKQIQNYQNSDYSLDHNNRKEDIPSFHSSQSRKNITFCFSNKNINEKIVKRLPNAAKRSSIAVVDDSTRMKIDSIQAKTRALPPKMGLSFSGNLSSSLKVIHQKKPDQKKTSVFCPVESKRPSQDSSGVEIKKLSDYLSMNSRANYQNQVPKIGHIYRHSVQERPEFLHYSTSSNPYNNRIKRNTNIFQLDSCQSISRHQIEEYTQGKEKNHRSETRNVIDQQLTESIVVEKKEPTVSAEQLVKDDLSALFNSDHEFDYGELQNELDHVLF